MISREECDGDLRWVVPPCSLALLPRKSSKGSDIHAVDRCDWGIALGHEGHLTEFMCPYTGVKRKTKSFTAFTLSPGQNAWHTLGLPSPLVPKSSFQRTAEHSNPGCTIIVLPFRLEPMKTNPVVEGIKLSDTPMQGQPMIHMFDNQGHLLLTDPETGQVFNSDKVAVPELLKLLGITRDPNIDFDSE